MLVRPLVRVSGKTKATRQRIVVAVWWWKATEWSCIFYSGGYFFVAA